MFTRYFEIFGCLVLKVLLSMKVKSMTSLISLDWVNPTRILKVALLRQLITNLHCIDTNIQKQSRAFGKGDFFFPFLLCINSIFSSNLDVLRPGFMLWICKCVHIDWACTV